MTQEGEGGQGGSQGTLLLLLSDPRRVKKAASSRNRPLEPHPRSLKRLCLGAPESSYLCAHSARAAEVGISPASSRPAPIMQFLPGPGLRAKSAPSGLARTGLAGDPCRSGCRGWREQTLGFWGAGEGSWQRLTGTAWCERKGRPTAAGRPGGRSEGGAPWGGTGPLPREFSFQGPHTLHLCVVRTSLGVRAKLWAAQASIPGCHCPAPQVTWPQRR